ncbi:MAG TPA: spore coat U domain-containing protein [Thermoanaerobaculia bacterium]|nr:spore coat U domain-containing protein [Thermoanaerobaculia bacterium]
MKKTCLVFIAAAMFVASRADAGNCRWLTPPTDIAFGIYSVFGTGSLTGTSTYTIRCTPNTEGVITLTTGANASNYFPRYMANAGFLLAYNLYDDAANTNVLGDGTGGTTTRVVFNGQPGSINFTDTIYAAAPQGSDVGPGTYTDTVTAVLSWDNGAGTDSRTFMVTTVVQAECTVSTVPVAFGNYDPVAAHAASPLDGTGSINVYCTPGTVATVSLGDGLYFAAGSRRMSGPPTSFLNYQLYREATRTSIWSTSPNTVSGTSTSRFTPIGGGLVVYGRVPAGQDAIIGMHNDTVQATVNY